MAARQKNRWTGGSTLLETVIAFFIIAGGLAVVAGIYASTMGNQADDVEAATIVSLAESRMAELRALADTSVDYLALDAQSGIVTLADPAGYQVETLVADTARAYPCQGLRLRDFTSSHKRARVTVTGPRGKRLSLVSIIGEPRREVQDLVVTQPTGITLLARDAQADFVARLNSTDGSEIADVEFRFYIDFGNGYGRLEEDPDGRTARFYNQILNVAGPNIYTGNSIRIVARTFYAGQEYRGVSPSLNLAN